MKSVFASAFLAVTSIFSSVSANAQGELSFDVLKERPMHYALSVSGTANEQRFSIDSIYNGEKGLEEYRNDGVLFSGRTLAVSGYFPEILSEKKLGRIKFAEFVLTNVETQSQYSVELRMDNKLVGIAMSLNYMDTQAEGETFLPFEMQGSFQAQIKLTTEFGYFETQPIAFLVKNESSSSFHTARFTSDFQVFHGKTLRRDSFVQVNYDTTRLMPENFRKDVWGYIQLDNAEPMAFLIQKKNSNKLPLPIVFKTLPNTQRVSMWFKAVEGMTESWDSNYGQNYVFELTDSPFAPVFLPQF